MNVAFIPVRGGSKSIPLKNIKPICGRPLVYWTVAAAAGASHIDKVYVSTDSEDIKNCVNSFGFNKVQVISRSAQTATDTASTESAMLEFAEQYSFDNIVLIQATSPLLTHNDIEGGFDIYTRPDVDSVLSAVKQTRFNWNMDEDGKALPLNYDYMSRPRRQEFKGYYTENGAFYITSRERLLKYKNRISGNISIYPMCEESFFEIDEPSDWIITEQLLRQRISTKVNGNKIRILLTDSDGCLTDGGMYYSPEGDLLKKFNAKDGMGLSILRDRGVIRGIVTGENSEIVRKRADKLSIEEVHLGIKDKLSAVKEILERLNIAPEDAAYVGDDINDIEVLDYVGHPFSIADAFEEVREHATYVTKRRGGDGAIREIVEYLKSSSLI